MRQVRFARTVYRGEDIDRAVKLYTPYGELSTSETDSHWVVDIECGHKGKERRLAGELCNYALGLTVQAGGVS